MPAPPPAPDAAAISRAAGLLNAARRPMLYLGGGVVASGASEAAVQLAERFCLQAAIIHIDIDESELDKILPVHCGITGDVGLALAELLPLLRPQVEAGPGAGREAWRERVAECRRQHPFIMPGADDPRTPYGLIRRAAGIVNREAIVATDVGQHQMRTAQAYPLCGPRRWLTFGGLGAMGFGLPAAIGAALARPEATVLCFTGDGSLQMNIQELATAAEEGVNVKILLADNNALGLVRQLRELFYEGRLMATAYRNTVDFVRIAEGFGVPAVDLDASDDPLRVPGPCLIRVTVPAEANVYPMVPPGADNLRMIGGESATAVAAHRDDDFETRTNAAGGRHAHAHA